MKITYILSLLFAALIFAGCASTKGSSQAEEPKTDTAQAQEETSDGSGLLMDRYKSGQIPGYRN